MSRQAIYKHYTIRSTPLQHPDSRQWTLTITIGGDHPEAVAARAFSAEHTFETEAEAEIHGIAYGQLIIDGRVPGCSVDQCFP